MKAFERQVTDSTAHKTEEKIGNLKIGSCLVDQLVGCLVCTNFLHPKTPVSHSPVSHSPRSFPWLKGSNVCFVPPLPALMNIPGCISVSNGDEGVACLKAHRAASKPRASCPENLLTTLFWPRTGSFCRPRQNAEWTRSVAGVGRDRLARRGHRRERTYVPICRGYSTYLSTYLSLGVPIYIQHLSIYL